MADAHSGIFAGWSAVARRFTEAPPKPRGPPGTELLLTPEDTTDLGSSDRLQIYRGIAIF